MGTAGAQGTTEEMCPTNPGLGALRGDEDYMEAKPLGKLP